MFTDEDLKKLKDNKHFEHYPAGCSISLPSSELRSLLARLECAEKALLNSEYQEANEFFEAWQKSKEPQSGDKNSSAEKETK